MIDGRSVYTPLFAGVYWNVQDTVLEDIERIEVIRGPGGTIWGRERREWRHQYHHQKRERYPRDAVVLVRGQRGSRRRRDSLRRYNRQGFQLPRLWQGLSAEDLSFIPMRSNFDEWRTGQLGFRTDWDPTSRDSITLQGDMYMGLDGERVAVGFVFAAVNTGNRRPHDVGGGNMLGRWKRKLSDGSDFQVQGYYDRTSRYSPQLDEMRDTFDIDFLYHVTLKGDQDVLLGAGARWSPDTITPKFQTLDFLPHQETDSIYSWFAQDQIPIVPKHLWLTIGSKFEHNNYTGFEIQPNARLLWTPATHQTFWTAVTRAVRTPSRLDQDLQLTDFLVTPPPTYLRVVGSKDFKSEQLLGIEFGYRTLVAKKVFIDLAVFHNRYTGLYGYGPGTGFVEPTPAPPHIILQLPLANALDGNTTGVEIAPDWKPVQWLELKGSYSYLSLTVRDRPGFTDALNTVADNGSSPHHQVTFQSLLNLPKRFELDATVRYVSALPAQAVDAYETADLRFGWHPAASWEFSLVGQNLLQPDHAEFGSDIDTIVGIRRSVYGRVTWTMSSEAHP